jgi:hypothetical protein
MLRFRRLVVSCELSHSIVFAFTDCQQSLQVGEGTRAKIGIRIRVRPSRDRIVVNDFYPFTCLPLSQACLQYTRHLNGYSNRTG